MSENKKKILEMLAKGKINVDDAYRLLSVIDADDGAPESHVKVEPEVKNKAKYLRVTVMPNPDAVNHAGDRINIRVPMSLIRSGIKLTSLIPHEAMDKMNSALHDKGINFDMHSVKPEDIEELITALGDMEIDVESSRGEKVKVYVE